MTKYVDCHCHLIKSINHCADNISKARSMGIDTCLCNATNENDWDALLALSKKIPEIRVAFGIHPWFISNIKSNWNKRLTKILLSNSNFMVGEIGLDKNKALFDLQENIFNIQMEIAERLNRCVTIHCLGAWDKILQYLKRNEKELPPCIIFHSYNGNEKLTTDLLNKCNAYFSYSLLNLNNITNKTKILVKSTPIDKILIESDSDNIKNTILAFDKIASILDIDKENLSKQIYANSQKVLNHGQTK